MRRQQQRSTLVSLLTSKRIAVALCAAIAMVIGAMSVGATTHTYGSDTAPKRTAAASQFDASSYYNVRPNNPKPEHSSKQTLSPILVAPPDKNSGKTSKPSLVKPNIIEQISLTLGPINVSADGSSDGLKISTYLSPATDPQPIDTPQNISADPTASDQAPQPAGDPAEVKEDPQTGSTLTALVAPDTTSPIKNPAPQN